MINKTPESMKNILSTDNLNEQQEQLAPAEDGSNDAPTHDLADEQPRSEALVQPAAPPVDEPQLAEPPEATAESASADVPERDAEADATHEAGTPHDDAPDTPEPPGDADLQKEAYWEKILTGDPATIPDDIRKKAGTDDWALPDEQKEYRLLATVNRSWAADHLPRSREHIRTTWKQHRAELARKHGVRDNEQEVFIALSEEKKNEMLKTASTEIYNDCYLAGLDGRKNIYLRNHLKNLSPEDRENAKKLAQAAFLQGAETRSRMQDLAQRIANGLDAFAAVEEDTFSAPRVVGAAPDLFRAIDELADMDEMQQNTALYLATGMVREQHRGYDAPGLATRTIQAIRRGASGIGLGVVQALSNVGIATMNKIGEKAEMEDLSDSAKAWDKRMQMLDRLRKLSQNELRPLVLPTEKNGAASYLITAAESVPAAVLSCCGGAGFSALTFGAVGEAVAEARARAPLASQELQLYAGLLGGAIQAGIYMNLNRVGGRLLEQSISRLARAEGQGISAYALSSLNVMGATSVEAAKMLAAGKLASASDLASQELAARLSHTASNIDWQEFGDNLTDIEANMHEAAGLLPFLLLGSGRLALQHFRSPRAIMGEGKWLADWEIPELRQQEIISERNLDTQSEMLRKSISDSKLWSAGAFMRSAWRALRLLHSDSFHGFKEMNAVRDFLQLPPPPEPTADAPTPAAAKLSEQGRNVLTLRRAAAINMWNQWWKKSGIDSTPAPYPTSAFSHQRKTPTERSTEAYISLANLMDSQVPKRMRELGVYAPHAEVERRMLLRDRVKDMEKLSYQFLMNLYSVDTLAKDMREEGVWRTKTEHTRQCLLAALSRSVIATARGASRARALKDIDNYLSNFFTRRKYYGVGAGWLREAQYTTLKNLPENVGTHALPVWNDRPELLDSFRIVSGVRMGVDALIDILPLMSDFQTALSRGLSPAQAYAHILAREFRLPPDMVNPDSIKLGRDIKNNTPMLQYTWENKRIFEIYNQLTGCEIEREKGDNDEMYSRVRRPNGSYTHWHSQDDFVMNDLAGNAAMFFTPFAHKKNMFSLQADPKSGVDLLKRVMAAPNEFTSYDQLCSLARHDIGRLWMSTATDIQPGMQLERMHHYFRLKNGEDGVTPQIYEDGKPGNKYKIDAHTEATPLSMAQSRFYVYWQRMINSGFVSVDRIGDFLVSENFITDAERQAIMNPKKASVYYWRNRVHSRKNRLREAQEERMRSIPRNMAEKMANYTTIRFLAQLPDLNVPQSFKEWIAMAPFCPEAVDTIGPDEVKMPKRIASRFNGSGLISWANRTVARKICAMAPQVAQMRAHLAEQKDRDSFVESLIGDAMGQDQIRRYEQGWCFEMGGAAAVCGAPQSFWNLLRSPRRAWACMDDEDRSALRAHLEPFCRNEPTFAYSEHADGADCVESAINLLDTLLQEYPQMHRFATVGKKMNRIRTIKFVKPKLKSDGMAEPLYTRLRLYEGGEISSGYKVSYFSPYVPDFFTNDSRVYPALALLDELRGFHAKLPHAYHDGVWWRGKMYGFGGNSPVDPKEYYPERPLEPLLNLLHSIGYQSLWSRKKVIVCGVRVDGLSPYDKLDLKPLNAVTVYRSNKDRRYTYRLMPGEPSMVHPLMRVPYLVHCRDGVYLNDHAVARTQEDMDEVCVPLHRFRLHVKRRYAENKDVWINNAWTHNLERALECCLEAPQPDDAIQHSTMMLEYLMRLTEDSGFSPSMAEIDPYTLSMGQAKLLNLLSGMVAFLCSPNPSEAAVSLAKLARTLNTPERIRELSRALRHANAAVPGTKIGKLLNMEDYIVKNMELDVPEDDSEGAADSPENSSEWEDNEDNE